MPAAARNIGLAAATLKSNSSAWKHFLKYQEVTEEDLLHDLAEIQSDNSEDAMKVKTLQGELIRVSLLSYATHMLDHHPRHLSDDGKLLAKCCAPILWSGEGRHRRRPDCIEGSSCLV
jgi:hypothetical protein